MDLSFMDGPMNLSFMDGPMDLSFMDGPMDLSLPAFSSDCKHVRLRSPSGVQQTLLGEIHAWNIISLVSSETRHASAQDNMHDNTDVGSLANTIVVVMALMADPSEGGLYA